MKNELMNESLLTVTGKLEDEYGCYVHAQYVAAPIPVSKEFFDSIKVGDVLALALAVRPVK